MITKLTKQQYAILTFLVSEPEGSATPGNPTVCTALFKKGLVDKNRENGVYTVSDAGRAVWTQPGLQITDGRTSGSALKPQPNRDLRRDQETPFVCGYLGHDSLDMELSVDVKPIANWRTGRMYPRRYDQENMNWSKS